ncbi:quinon protein alcohol dehydrogenase-like superfamily [Mycena crocata]|nr:quinon protein alcohol dehydrogenase-like superfamily [Mycena crocata]
MSVPFTKATTSADFFKDWKHSVKDDFQKNGSPAASDPWVSEGPEIRLDNEETQVAALSHDNSLIAAAVGQEVRVYDASTAQVLHTLRGHEGHIARLEFHPAGRKLVSGSSPHGTMKERLVKVWNLETVPQPPDLNCDEAAEIAAAAISPILLRRWSAEALESVNLPLQTAIAKLITLALTGQEFLGELAQYRSRVFSHDGTSLLYLPTSNNLAVVDVATMTERFRSSGHGGTIMWAETSPNDKVIATSSFDKTVRIWSMNSGETLHVLRGATGQSWGGAFSPNGEFVAAGAGDGMVRIWRVDTGELLHTLGGFQRWVRSVAFSPDNLSLAAGGAAGILRVFNVKSGDCEQNWQLDLGGHSASALFLEIRLVQYTPRGDLFFTSPEGRIYGYRASHNLKWEHLGRSYGTMAASTDGSKLLTTVGSSVDI